MNQIENTNVNDNICILGEVFFRDNVAGEQQYTPDSTFMTHPHCYVAGGDQTFMVYRVVFSTTGNTAYVSVSTGCNLHWELELKLLSVDNMTSLKDVKKEVTR